MRTLTHKGYGRIYCETAPDVQRVHDVIKKMDETEYTLYMPSGLVAPFSEYPRVTFVHKFSDMDVDEIVARCWKEGLKIWVFDSGYDGHPKDATA